MAIPHKFKNTHWGNGFATNNAILDVTPYEPEVLILGTFNPDTPNANHADFFYGRNLFWPAFKNLFIHNGVEIGQRRMPSHGAPHAVLNPTLEDIFELCMKLKLTFADLVSEVLHEENLNYELLQNDNILLDGNEYNLIQDGQNNNIGGLAQLDVQNLVNWNTMNIVNFLVSKPTIKYIYLTRRPTGVWAAQWNQLANNPILTDRYFTNIFTPSGAGAPVHRNMNNLLAHWLHNQQPNFGHLDNNWLINQNVTINNF